MGRARIMVILTIIIATLLSIAYLLYQSKELEKYTSTTVDGNTTFIIYSSEGAILKDNATPEALVEACRKSLTVIGYDVVKVEGNAENLRNEILKAIKGNKKYIILDINAGMTVVSNNTLLVRVSSKDSEKYKENLKNAELIKKNISTKGTKINIYTEGKKSLNQDIGTVALRFEVSKQNTLKEAQELIVNAAYAMTRE